MPSVARADPATEGTGAMPAVLAANDEVSSYLPVLMMLLFAVSFAALNLVLSFLAGTKARGNPVKDAAYECGMPSITDPHAKFSVKFYLVALLFVLFDIEVVFFYPWAVYFHVRPMF